MLCMGFEPHEPVLRQMKTLRAIGAIGGDNSDRPNYKSRLLAAVSGDIPTLTHFTEHGRCEHHIGSGNSALQNKH
jgi:hypothetical protein